MIARSMALRGTISRMLGARSILSSDLVAKAAVYEQKGYLVIPNALHQEDADDMRSNANLLLKSLAEQHKDKGLAPAKDHGHLQQDYLYFSGGRKVKSPIKEIKLTGNVHGILGEGIIMLAKGLHNSIEVFENFAYSSLVKKISRELFGMRAPLIAASSYISSLSKEWCCVRKDNSFIRTTPLSTQSILIALNDTNKDEGFFVVKSGDQMRSPASFLRKVHCDPAELLKEQKTEQQRCAMMPELEKILEPKGECVPLNKGDVLAYHGNLSYYLSCPNPGNSLLLLHLVEGRGTKWAHDNVCDCPTEMLFKTFTKVHQ